MDPDDFVSLNPLQQRARRNELENELAKVGDQLANKEEQLWELKRKVEDLGDELKKRKLNLVDEEERLNKRFGLGNGIGGIERDALEERRAADSNDNPSAPNRLAWECTSK